MDRTVKIVHVVATDTAGGIGIRNSLPWNVPSDLAHFRALTMGHPVLMGHATHRSIGRPLPGRTNIVLSRSVITIPGCIVRSSITDAIETAGALDDVLYVIGGAQVYASTLDICTRIERTLIPGTHACDTFFPIDPRTESEWILTVLRKPEEDPSIQFETWERFKGFRKTGSG